MDPTAVTGVDFAVDSISFADAGDTRLAVARGAFPRGRTALDGVAVPRRGERPEGTRTCSSRLGDPVRRAPAAAGHRRAQAQRLPHRWRGAALVRAGVMGPSVRERRWSVIGQVPSSIRGASSSSCWGDDPGRPVRPVDHDREVALARASAASSRPSTDGHAQVRTAASPRRRRAPPSAARSTQGSAARSPGPP